MEHSVNNDCIILYPTQHYKLNTCHQSHQGLCQILPLRPPDNMPSTRPAPLISHCYSTVYMDYPHKNWSADNAVSLPAVLPVSLIAMPDLLPVYSYISFLHPIDQIFFSLNFIITGNHKINTDFITATEKKATHPLSLIADMLLLHRKTQDMQQIIYLCCHICNHFP